MITGNWRRRRQDAGARAVRSASRRARKHTHIIALRPRESRDACLHSRCLLLRLPPALRTQRVARKCAAADRQNTRHANSAEAAAQRIREEGEKHFDRESSFPRESRGAASSALSRPSSKFEDTRSARHRIARTRALPLAEVVASSSSSWRR